MLKGKSTGRATIKLSLKTSARKTKNTKTLKCRVNVIAANQGQNPGTDPGTQKPVSASATVGTQAELDAALANAALTDITIRTDSAVNLTIPAGSHSSVNLTVDAPSASVTNSGVFKSIILASIKADTWTEKAQGNTFRVTASKARIVADTASKIARVIVTKADADVVIVSNGTLGGITISAKAKVTLSGTAAENAALIPVMIEAAAAGAEFRASLPVAVETAADAVIELQEKAEKSTISIVNESAVVTVKNNTKGYTVPVKRGNITRNVSKGTQVLKPSTATSQGGSTGGGYWGGGSGITVNKKQAKNQAELDKWLKDSSVTQITIVSSEADADKKITINSGSYRNIDLIVDAPEKTIVNEAVFKSVEIKDIAAETWTEKARGNTLKISAPNPHIIVDKNASVSGISFTKPDGTKGGVMKRMKLDVQGTVNGAVSFGTLVKNADVKVAKGASLAKGVSFSSGAGKSNVKLNVAGTVGDVSCNAADAKLTVTMEDNAASVGNVSVNTGMDVAIKAAEAVTNLAKQIAVVLKNAAAKLSSQVIVSVTVQADNASVVLSASAEGSELTYGSGVTTAGISTTIKILETDSIDGIPSECQIWNIERLFQLCGSDSGRHIIEINFKEYTDKGIPCLEASSVALDDFKSYLCIIPGTALADIYDKFGSSLLEGNVRSFLSTKVAVNKKIRTTILQQPERFFAYNNGISATAMDVQFEHTEQGLFLVSARDFQIINGGQTTASLSSARYNYKDKANLGVIFVQMKLTVINGTLEDDVATTLVQNISRSSNSQNKVSDADFFSTHPFHVQMERCSQRLGARGTGGLQFETKWFYERARGQYLQKQMRMTASEKKKFLLQHPKNQLITKTDLAKVRNTWDGLPHIVSKGAQANFMDFAQKISDAWDKDDGLLFGDKYFQESVALCLIFRYTEIMIPHQPWYQQGYRANIVTYTIAILHKLIRTQFPKKDLDLTRIWVRQTIPAAVQNVLVELSKCVYERLTDPMRSIDNVTQWCKREGCWNSVQSIDFKLPSEIEDCLVGQDAMRTVIKEAKAERRIEMDADVMTRVVEIRPNQWHNVMDFAVSRRMITSEEKTALCIACQLPTKVPTPAQSRRLIQLLDRLYEEGFKL